MGNLKMRPLRTLAGAYLLYLAYQQARLFLQGETETHAQAVICVVSGVVFVAAGVWVLWREWKYAKASGEEPETDGGADTTDDSEAERETEEP